MNKNIRHNYVYFDKKEPEVRTGIKSAGDEMRYAWYPRYLYPPFSNKL
ncbi:MAG: hypothetical protein PVG06_12940 [Desulfobacterales bacterium]